MKQAIRRNRARNTNLPDARYHFSPNLVDLKLEPLSDCYFRISQQIILDISARVHAATNRTPQIISNADQWCLMGKLLGGGGRDCFSLDPRCVADVPGIIPVHPHLVRVLVSKSVLSDRLVSGPWDNSATSYL